MSHILVVDDMVQSLKYLALFLKRGGFEVSTADSYDNALDVLETKAIDLILLDVMMPKVDGYEACRLFKKDPLYSSIPVIFVTSCDTGETITACFDAGGADYVHKFSTQKELLARVKTQLKLVDATKQEHNQLRLFSLALNSLPDVIYAATVDGKVIFGNTAFQKFTGTINCFISEFTESSSKHLGCNLFHKAIETQENVFERVQVDKVVRELTAVPIVNKNINEVKFVFIVSRDITDQEEMAGYYRKSQKMETISRISGAVAHEMNNILGGIVGTLTLLRLPDSEGIDQDLLFTELEKSSARGSQVVSQLLEFAAHRDTVMESLPLEELIKASIGLISATHKSYKKIEYTADANSSSFRVTGDSGHLRHMIYSVLIYVFEQIDRTDAAYITVSEESSFTGSLAQYNGKNYYRLKFGSKCKDDKEGLFLVENNRLNKDASALAITLAEEIVKDFEGFVALHGDSSEFNGVSIYLPTEINKVNDLLKFTGVLTDELLRQLIGDYVSLLGFEPNFFQSTDDLILLSALEQESISVLFLDFEDFSLAKRTVKGLRKFMKNSKIIISLPESHDGTGADAVLVKPFKMQELSLVIKNVLQEG